MRALKLENFKGGDAILMSGDSNELLAFAKFLASWSESPTEGTLSDLASISCAENLEIGVVSSEDLGGGGMLARSDGLYVWAMSRSQALEFSNAIAELARTPEGAHVYLDGVCDDVQVIVSKGEYS